MRKLFTSTLLLLGASLLSTPANAAVITGHIGFGGGIVYDTRGAGGAGLSILDFAPVGGGTGNVLQIGGVTGYFSNIDFGSSAKILDLTNDATAVSVPGPVMAPAGVPLAINNFLSNFSDPDAAGLSFQLTKLVLQTGPVCTGTEGAGDSCVEGPFSLLQTNNGLKINFDVLGYFTKGADSGYFKGSFGSTFGGMTFAQAFARLDGNPTQDLMCGVNNLETPCTFEGNFDATVVPEPATLLTFGAGLALLGAAVRRRKAQVNG